jgi:hypothetical protein
MAGVVDEPKPAGVDNNVETSNTTISSGDVDDALRFLKAEGQNESLANIDEKSLLRKIDWFIMPILFSVYFLQYTDKTLCKKIQNAPSFFPSLFLVHYSKLRLSNGYYTR